MRRSIAVKGSIPGKDGSETPLKDGYSSPRHFLEVVFKDTSCTTLHESERCFNTYALRTNIVTVVSGNRSLTF